MTESSELKTQVGQLHQQVFGIEGQGGLVREVNSLKDTVIEHDRKLNLMGAKWLFLTLLAGALGSGLGQTLLSTFLTLKH